MASSSGCGRGIEVHAEAELERQHVPDRDRAGRGHGGAVDGAPSVDQHPPVGELGEEVVDRIVEPQPALLHEHEGGDGHDRLGHRHDPEDAVPADGLGPAPGQDAGDPDLHVLVPGPEPRHAGDVIAFHMARHRLAQPVEPSSVESTHRDSDVSGRGGLIGRPAPPGPGTVSGT